MPDHDINDRLSDECFEAFLALVHSHTGITIGTNRKSMLIGRLRRRLRANNLQDFEGYLDFVRNNKSEIQHFVDNVTTNETYFYRTPRVWQYLTDEVIPNHVENAIDRPMRVWSAAASTGEEAHTVAIFLEETKRQHPRFKFDVLGTDISSRVIEAAREGNYSQRAVDRFRKAHPTLFDTYITGDDDAGYRVIESVRSKLSFQNHNLFRVRNTQHKFDVVFLRNVLIYFTKEDQEKVLANIERVLSPEGVLIIGESETLAQLNTNFNSVAPLVYRCATLPKRNAA